MTDTAITAIHLDAVGGLAGDMFAAAMLDARPDLWPDCERAIAALGLPEGIAVASAPHSDDTFRGTRFQVSDLPDGGGHGHVHWAAIRDRLSAAALEDPVREAALAIFRHLAEAEAAVHGIAVDDVAFHEVGAHDSIVDIVAAAALIAAVGPCRWSIGAIPRGRGLVKTRHGMLPVPAPATVELLRGFVLFDDGEEGERVTPTGAAILRHLAPCQAADFVPRRLLGAGVGFGTRRLASRSNILRATLYAAAETAATSDQVAVLRCEIDDQTGEDLAVAVDNLRRTAGVLDVCQWPVFGKKGRMATALQVLAVPGEADRVIDEMLDETTTLGVRRGLRDRRTVARDRVEVAGVAVKRAHRPAGLSAKAEMDDLAGTPGAAERQRLRRAVEAEAESEGDGDA